MAIRFDIEQLRLSLVDGRQAITQQRRGPRLTLEQMRDNALAGREPAKTHLEKVKDAGSFAAFCGLEEQLRAATVLALKYGVDHQRSLPLSRLCRPCEDLLATLDGAVDVLELLLARETLEESAESEGTPDSKPDNGKFSWPQSPNNPNVSKLANMVRKNVDKQRKKIDMAREIEDGDETKAQSLVRQLRNFPHLMGPPDRGRTTG
jgi:hypothetical protein